MYGEFKGISGWQKTSFIDYPGTVSTVLFFEGCNLRCPYCHNPDIVLRKNPQLSWTEIKSHLSSRKGLIEGVVLTGGEPTLHSCLPQIVNELRDDGFLIKIDTNGANPDMIAQCKPDYLALDFKTIPQRYEELGCKDSGFGGKLKRTLEIVKSMGLQAEVRITVAPPFIDDNTVLKMAEMLNGVERVFLQQLRITTDILDNSYSAENVVPLKQIEKYRDMITPFVGSCAIRGI